jgi:Zn-finger protein
MSYKFFSNTECEYYPCHKIDEINCLFCYCPLYYKEEECGGNYVILPNGIKDCSNCLIPHYRGGYNYIIKKLRGIK